MGVLGEGSAWCFCSGGGKLERIKSTILATKGAAFAAVSFPGGGGGGGSGFLIRRGLLLTTHATIPSAAAAGVAEVWLSHGRLAARLVPQRFFVSSSILDLTIVGFDIVDDDSTSHGQQPHFLKTCFNPSLDLGSTVLLLGHTNRRNLTVGEGKVVIATDNLIKLSTDGVTWRPGSAGFDMHGNLAFMVCDPMKLAPSTPTGYASASSTALLASRKDVPTQFGIPISVVCEWLKQHWNGSLDDVSKPNLPPARLVSAGQRSEHSSFSHLQSIKTMDQESGDELSSSQIASRPIWQHGSCSVANAKISYDENDSVVLHSSHEQENLTSQIYKPKNEQAVPLLDVNSPPRPRSIVLPLPLKQMMCDENNSEVLRLRNQSSENESASRETLRANPQSNYEVLHSAAYQDNCWSEVQSSFSPLEISDLGDERDGFSSGEETMYSAETRESRNIPSPNEKRLETVGTTQSYVNHSRWDSPRSFESSKGASWKPHTLIPLRKPHLQAAAISQKSHDYFSPTVSSNMKKRNLSQIPMKPRQSAQVSSKWII